LTCWCQNNFFKIKKQAQDGAQDDNRAKYRFCIPNKFTAMHCKTFFLLFLDSRKPHLLESALYELRWASKTLTVPDSYKRCTLWLELEQISNPLPLRCAQWGLQDMKVELSVFFFQTENINSQNKLLTILFTLLFSMFLCKKEKEKEKEKED